MPVTDLFAWGIKICSSPESIHTYLYILSRKNYCCVSSSTCLYSYKIYVYLSFVFSTDQVATDVPTDDPTNALTKVPTDAPTDAPINTQTDTSTLMPTKYQTPLPSSSCTPVPTPMLSLSSTSVPRPIH